MSDLAVLAGLVIVGFVVIAIWLERRLSVANQTKIQDLVDQIFGHSAEKIAKQSRDILAGEREIIKTDLENKHQQISKLIKQLEEDLQSRQREINRVEKERGQQFGELAKALEQQRQVSTELRESTQQLNRVLSSNQQRGEWGERIIEDLLQANGLMEGVHYARQKPLGETGLRPDITLLLPNDRSVPVDVKFPLSELQKIVSTDSKQAKEIHAKQFARDVKGKIDKVAEYIDPAAGTLDYAILFVPNEAVFAYLNRMNPEILDYALSKRILVVSPFTFLIVARTVMESYRNFMIGDKLKEVVRYIDDFVGEWGKFRDKFEKYGRSIDTLKSDYDELIGTRVRQMERRIGKIQEVGSGRLLEEGKK